MVVTTYTSRFVDMLVYPTSPAFIVGGTDETKSKSLAHPTADLRLRDLVMCWFLSRCG
jgi:hypothetical protein